MSNKPSYLDVVREALRNYGQHFQDCRARTSDSPCECGLDDVLVEADRLAALHSGEPVIHAAQASIDAARHLGYGSTELTVTPQGFCTVPLYTSPQPPHGWGGYREIEEKNLQTNTRPNKVMLRFESLPFPEPFLGVPEVGRRFWLLDLATGNDDGYCSGTWQNSAYNRTWLGSGLIHLSEDDVKERVHAYRSGTFIQVQSQSDYSESSHVSADGREGLQVPPGWKLVPIEPTNEMCAAGWNVDTFWRRLNQPTVYSAMIAAAPSPPKENGIFEITKT